MPEIRTSVCVNYTAEEMYALVNDVRAYPKYILMCSDVKLLEEQPDKLKATITMSKGMIRLSFTTLNTMVEGASISMQLVEGPFKKMNGVWRFDPSESGGCEVDFKLHFEFASAMLSVAFNGLFKEVTESMVSAFCKQAAVIYGPRR